MPAFAGYELVSLARLLTFAVKAGNLCHFAVTNRLSGELLAGVSSRPYLPTITLVSHAFLRTGLASIVRPP